MDFSYVDIRYFIGYVYHICLQDTIQSTLSLCLLCQAMLLPMPPRPLLLTTRSGFSATSDDNMRNVNKDEPDNSLLPREEQSTPSIILSPAGTHEKTDEGEDPTPDEGNGNAI